MPARKENAVRSEELARAELAGPDVDDDLSRGEVIVKGALAVGALYGAASVAPFVGRALAKSNGGDVGVLNFALTLEYLESTFYTEAKTRAKASGELKSLIDLIAAEEDEHAKALTEAIEKLGGKPAAEPEFDFPYKGVGEFLELAQTFEETAISAYNGAVPELESNEALALAASIVQVEARHAAAIRLQNGQEPAPEGFDFPAGKDADLKAIEPFIQ
jgi:rubrerythrin